KDRAHAGGLTDAERGNRGLYKLHRVVDREPGGDRAAWRIDVHVYFALGVFGLEEQELRGDQVGEVVGHWPAEEDYAVFEEAGVNVVGTFAAAGLLNNVWDENAHSSKVLRDFTSVEELWFSNHSTC